MKQLKTRLLWVLLGGMVMGGDEARAAPLEGQWAGDRLQLVIDSSGGRVAMDCASGRFPGPVQLDAAGSFAVKGTLDPHNPGAQRAEGGPPPRNVRYQGELKDEDLRLSISPEGGGTPEVFHLRRGARIKLVPCL